MPNITCYGGVGEIGGNKVLLEDEGTRIFFDFGFPFKKRARYFEEFLSPRPGAGLLDLMEVGLIPPIKGILREDLARLGSHDPQKIHHLRFELHDLVAAPNFRALRIDQPTINVKFVLLWNLSECSPQMV